MMPESRGSWNTPSTIRISHFPVFGVFPYIKGVGTPREVGMAELMDWEELLTFETFSDYKDEYGPHTQAVVNCFETLDTISWFSQVGAEHPGRPEQRVDTWSDALDPLFHKPTDAYDQDGHLREPSELIEGLRNKRGFTKWNKSAISAVAAYTEYNHYIPSYFEKNEVGFMKRYMDKYFEHLLIEIITADEHDCTFYRQQLTWWEAGHFVCGWVGEWPEGVLRVF